MCLYSGLWGQNMALVRSLLVNLWTCLLRTALRMLHCGQTILNKLSILKTVFMIPPCPNVPQSGKVLINDCHHSAFHCISGNKDNVATINEHVLTEVPAVYIAHFTAWLQLCKVGVLICILQMVEMRFKEFKKLTWHLTGWKWWIWDLGFTLELKLLHYCQWFMY